MIALDSAWRISPHEFFAFPLRRNTPGYGTPDDGTALQSFYEELNKWKDHLNAFYFLAENCHVLKFADILHAWAAGQSVFAMYCNSTLGETHNFVRVRVVHCYDGRNMTVAHEHCKIKFLDAGGQAIVPSGSLLRMHSS